MNGKRCVSLWLAVVMVFQMVAPSLVWAVTRSTEPAYTMTFDITGSDQPTETADLKDAFVLKYDSVSEEYTFTEPTADVTIGSNTYRYLALMYNDGTDDKDWVYTTVVDDDTVVTATWIQVYEVSFVVAGETPEVQKQQVEHGKNATAPSDVSKGYHTFSKWVNDDTDDEYAASDLIGVESDLSYTAVWTPWTVTPDLNLGSDTGKTFTYSFDAVKGIVTLPSDEKMDDYAPDDKVFSHWGYTATATLENKIVVSEALKTNEFSSGNVIIYAIWKDDVDTYSVTFKVAANTTANATAQSVKVAELATTDFLADAETAAKALTTGKLDLTTPDGYEFDGWYDSDPDGTDSTAKLLDSTTTTIEDKATYYGRWVETVVEPTTVDVTFVVAASTTDGNDNQTVKVTVADTSTVTNAVTAAKALATGALVTDKTGFTLSGWYTDTNYSTEVLTTATVSETTYYAKWLEADTFKVTFTILAGAAADEYAQYGTVDLNVGTAFSSALGHSGVSLSTNKPAGFSFGGWYTDKDLTTSADTSANITAAADYYGQWVVAEDSYEITVQYNLNGGAFATGVASTLVVIGNTYDGNKPDEATYSGYKFGGWYTDSTFATPFVWTYSDYDNGEKINLYARWMNPVTVQFDVNGGVSGETPPSQQLYQGDSVANVTQPSHIEGQVFLGWFTAKDDLTTLWDFTTSKIPDDQGSIMNLYAMWEEPVTIYFLTNGAESPSSIPSQDIVIGKKVTEPTDVLKTGYQIASWNVLAGTEPHAGDEAWNFTMGVTESMTLYPVWEKQTFTVRFYKNGGNVDGNTMPQSATGVEYGATIEDIVNGTNELERMGYDFKGWIPKDTDGNVLTGYAAGGYWDFNTNTVTCAVDLTADWERDENDAFSVLVITKMPTVVNYYVGDMFDPTGMVIEAIMESGLSEVVEYSAETANVFQFSVALDQLLTTDDVVVTVTYEGMTADIVISVEEIPVYIDVTGRVLDSDGMVCSGAVVWLMQNGELVAHTTSNDSGYYTFTNVGAGLFNVYVTYTIDNAKKSKTALVSLTGNKQELADIQLPGKMVSTNVAGDIYVTSNLDSVAEYLSSTESSDAIVQVDLTLSATVSAYDQNYIRAYMNDDLELGEFFSLSLMKRVSYLNTPTVYNIDVVEANELIGITIELNEADRGNYDYLVYRYDRGAFEALSETANSSGEFIYVNASKTLLTLYVKKFSSFAIAYTTQGDFDDWEGNDDDGSVFDDDLGEYRYAVTVTKYVNGTGTSDVTLGGNYYLSESYPIHSTKVTIRLIEYEGYMIDYVKAVDRNGNEVKVLAQEDGTYYFTQAGAAVDLLVAFTNPLVPTSPDGYQGFFDVAETDWYYNYVLKASHLGFMAGVGNGYFDPEGQMTRAMIIMVLYNLAGKPTVPYQVVYSDISYTDWYWEAVLWARSVGVADGYMGMFRPNDAITREELALMLYKYAQLDSSITQIVFPFEVSYADDNQISTWAKAAVVWCTNKGVFVGKSLNYFYPNHHTTRGEVATCLLAFLDQKV